MPAFRQARFGHESSLTSALAMASRAKGMVKARRVPAGTRRASGRLNDLIV